MTNQFLLDSGFQLKSNLQILEDLKTKVSKIDKNWKYDPQTDVLSAILPVIALQISEGFTALKESYYSNFIDSASGISLDKFGDNLGISRVSATFSTAQIVVKGNAGLVLPVNTKIFVHESSATFQTISTNTIANNDVAQIVELRSVSSGAVQAPVGSLRAGENIIGIEYIANTEPATLGKAQQSDDEYRAFIKSQLGVLANSSYFGIRQKLLALTFVSFCDVFSNVDFVYSTDDVLLIDVNGLKYGETKVVLEFIDDTQNRAEIARVLGENVAAGTILKGNISVSYQNQVFRFQSADLQYVVVIVEIKTKTKAKALTNNEIVTLKANIQAINSNITVGDVITKSMIQRQVLLSAKISNFDLKFGITTTDPTIDSDPLPVPDSDNDITPVSGKKFFIPSNYISITGND